MRSAYTFPAAILIAGLFAFAYMLMNPFFGLAMEASNQLSTMFADVHGVYSLIWAILPVIVIF